MAKTNLPFDVDSFIEKQKSNLSAEELQGITELTRGYMRNDDYQRTMNRLKTEYGAKDAEVTDWANRLKEYENEHIQLIGLRDEIERIYGSIDSFRTTADPNVLRTPTGDLVARKDVENLQSTIETLASDLRSTKETLASFAAGSMALMHKMPKYVRDYEKKYEKDFDGAAFLAFAQENSIADPDTAFQLFTLKDEQDRLKKQHEKEIAEAKDQAVRDFATKHHIPEDNPRTVQSPLRMVPRPTNPTSHPAPAAPAPIAAPPVPPSPSSNLNTALAGANDLRARMQANFLANKDK